MVVALWRFLICCVREWLPIEASAVGSSRTVNVAQVTYAATYPQRGFCAGSGQLASDPRGGKAESPEHAGLLTRAWPMQAVPVMHGVRSPGTASELQRSVSKCHARNICGGYSGGQQHRNKKFLFDF